MNDAVAVGMSQGAGNGQAAAHDLTNRHPLAAGIVITNLFAQGAAGEILESKKRLLPGLIDLEDGAMLG